MDRFWELTHLAFWLPILVIDLSFVCPELAYLANDADLVIVEGMVEHLPRSFCQSRLSAYYCSTSSTGIQITLKTIVHKKLRCAHVGCNIQYCFGYSEIYLRSQVKHPEVASSWEGDCTIVFSSIRKSIPIEDFLFN